MEKTDTIYPQFPPGETYKAVHSSYPLVMTNIAIV